MGTIESAVRAAYAAPLIRPSEGELGRVRAAFTALAAAQWAVRGLPGAGEAMAAYAPLHGRIMEAEEFAAAGKRGGSAQWREPVARGEVQS